MFADQNDDNTPASQAEPQEPTQQPREAAPESDPAPEQGAPEAAPPPEQGAAPEEPQAANPEEDDRVLYVTRNLKRFFAVPRGVSIAKGDLDVFTYAGGLLKLDAAALAPWEINEKQAREWFQHQLRGALGHAATALEQGADALKDLVEKIPIPDKNKAIGAVADVLGIEPDKLREDPGVVADVVRDKANELGRKLRETFDPGPEAKESFIKGIDSLIQATRKGTAEAAEQFRTAAEKLRKGDRGRNSKTAEDGASTGSDPQDPKDPPQTPDQEQST